MGKLIKHLAVWIIILALPVQGLAATSMMNCEKSHSHQSQTLDLVHNHELHSTNHESNKHLDSHERISIDKVSNDEHHSSSNTHTCSHCGTCNVCCASSAIVASALSIPIHFDKSIVNLTYLNSKFTSFIPAGIERPPRYILV